MIHKAVILAAGAGNRISSVSQGTHKPLLPLNGKPGGMTFLDWHLQQLSSIGVEEVFIVGNDKTFESPLQSTPLKPTWILNPSPDLSLSGSGHSADFAWRSEHKILDGKSRVLLMDADILYETQVLELLKASPLGASKNLVCSDFRTTDEEVLVFGRESLPLFLGKGLLNTRLSEGYTCFGEATGLTLWEGKDHELLQEVTQYLIQYSTAKTRIEHEDISQRMMSLNRVEVIGFGKELTFMECDTPDEYRLLTEEVFPKLSLSSPGTGSTR